MRDKHEQEKSDWKLNLLIQKCITSVDANESLFESVLIFIDVLALDDFILSFLSLDLRTAPTRSLAKRDHDSIRLCASQQAAGVRPLILSVISELRHSLVYCDKTCGHTDFSEKNLMVYLSTGNADVQKIIYSISAN